MALIYEKLARIASKIPAIDKDAVNKPDGYRYRSIYHIYNELHPLFQQEGVFLLPNVLDNTETVVETNKGRAFRQKTKVQWSFVCEDGSQLNSTSIGEGIDTSDKGVNKSLTGSLKYLLAWMFLIPTKPNEIDADSETLTVQEPKSLLMLLETKGLQRSDLKEIAMILGMKNNVELSAEDRKRIYNYVIQNY